MIEFSLQQIAFDLIIALSIIVGFFGIYLLYIKKPTWVSPLSKQYKSLLTLLILTCGMVLTYGSFIEPKLVSVEEVDVNLEMLETDKPIRLAVLSDFHVGTYTKKAFIQKVVEKTLQAQPDIVLLVGDYVITDQKDAMHLEPLTQLAKKVPTFAVWGNHDYNLGRYPIDFEDKTQKAEQLFRESDITILNNDNKTVYVQGHGVNIAGIDELWGYFDDIEKALDITNTYPTILMSHNPDAINQLQDHLFADLLVSGHTHGGQIRLPFIGPLVSVPTELGNDFDKGLFSWQNGTQLYITPGIGVTGVRARLFNPPTISILNLL